MGERAFNPVHTAQRENTRRERPAVIKEALNATFDEAEATSAEATWFKKPGKGKEAWQTFKKARELRAEHVERWRDADERYAAIIRRERKLWDAGVAQYGEVEAKRRYDEVAARRKAANELDTSEIEDLSDQEKEADPEIELTLLVRVNTKVEIAKKLGSMRLSRVDFYWIDEVISEKFK